MKKQIVVYYSKNGSNKFLAEKAAAALQCEIISLKPRLNLFLFLLLSSATNISLGNKSIKQKICDYESIILCGPIWMGQFISPLSDFVKKYKKEIKQLSFMTCCGSTDLTKEDKFGYAHVFLKIRKILGENCRVFEAFPIDLILSEDQKKNDEAMMNTRLAGSNFTGDGKKRFDNFIHNIG
ncbi:MAG: hypothetical protein PF518_07120 [Spirochaetaceae bacterium]|jgi:hypothetical protein|nr:hypothetical protein [Spirochaetaceae bacterium]